MIALSSVQKEIVLSDEAKIVVAAAAGSGKTRVLTERIRSLIIDKHVDPVSIVAITFTNMAAEEMKERLQDVPYIGEAFVGTIHSFANRVYKASGEKYKLATEEVMQAYWQYLIEKYCGHLTYKAYLHYSDLKAKVALGFADNEDVQECLLPSQRDEMRKLTRRKDQGQEYEKKYPETIESLCLRDNAITFDQLIKKCTEYFKSLDVQIGHVLVDELQDVGSLEFEFIMSLNAQNYFFVGDDFQNLYSFKGANVKLFMDLVRRDSGFKKYIMTENYRSAPEILALADKIVRQIEPRINKHVIAMKKTQGRYIVDGRGKLPYYLQRIKAEVNKKDWFILVRTNKDLVETRDMLQAQNVPYTTFRRSEVTLAEMRRLLDENTVKLLTVHMAKGLEAEHVILYGKGFTVQEPSYRKNSDERKVMYVGVTRAMRDLYILNG